MDAMDYTAVGESIISTVLHKKGTNMKTLQD